MNTTLRISLLPLSLVLFVALSISFSPVAWGEQATLVKWLKTGAFDSTRKADVVTEDCDSITYAGLGKQARGDVIYIEYGTNADYKVAENQRDEGEDKAAIKAYQAAMDKGKEEWLPWYCLFRIGETFYGIGDAPNAAKSFEDLNNKYPRNPFYPQVCCYLADIYMIQGKKDDADAQLKAVAAKANVFQACWVEKAQVLQGRLLIAKKQYQESIRHLKNIQTRLTYVPMLSDSRFALGECYETMAADTKDVNSYKEASKVFEGIAAELDESTMGEAYLRIARISYNLSDYEGAYGYALRAAFIFTASKYWASSPNYNKASEGLYYASKSLFALFGREKDATKKEAIRAELRIVLDILKSRNYAGMQWSIKAGNEIK